MALHCTVCDHVDLKVIDHILAVGKSKLRDMARRFGLSEDALSRHRSRHLSPRLRRAVRDREDLDADQLIQKLADLLEQAEAGIELARKTKDLTGLARCIKEARETIVYIGKTYGMWTDKPQTLIDARQQMLVLGDLTTDELRRLAAIGPGAGRDDNGGVTRNGHEQLENPLVAVSDAVKRADEHRGTAISSPQSPASVTVVAED